MKEGTICPDCGSAKLDSHPDGLDCADCGMSLPGTDCAKCGRLHVAAHHISPSGEQCFQATDEHEKPLKRKQKKLCAGALTRPPLPEEVDTEEHLRRHPHRAIFPKREPHRGEAQ